MEHMRIPVPSTLTETQRTGVSPRRRGTRGRIHRARVRPHLSWSMCWSASYMQKGLSMVVHSFMNSMEPPVSAEMSQMASSLQGATGVSGGPQRRPPPATSYLCGSAGEPSLAANEFLGGRMSF